MRLSTDQLADRDRLAIWHEVYGRYMLNIEIEPLGDGPFRAELALRALPGVNVLLGSRSSTRTSVTRPRLQTASDSLVLAIVSKGRALATQLGREAEIPLGGAVLMTSSELASHTLEDDGSLLTVQLPRASMAPYVPDIGASLMRTFSPDSDALRLLTGYAGGALALGETTSPELQATVAQHLRDLLAILLGTQGDARQACADGGVRAARLRAIKGQVIAQLGHGELSAESVAIPLRITANYVRKLLHSEGFSFSDYVLGLRLERTLAMLRNPRLADRAISWIAFDAGFNDISYFNRSFRKRYGMTPGDVRHEARIIL
jgi:AraC-like DNA-binding protein